MICNKDLELYLDLQLFWTKEEIEKLKTHKWIKIGDHDYLQKCLVCNLELYQCLTKYFNLNCEEVCIKQIIE